jgi:hypothetical protein
MFPTVSLVDVPKLLFKICDLLLKHKKQSVPNCSKTPVEPITVVVADYACQLRVTGRRVCKYVSNVFISRNTSLTILNINAWVEVRERLVARLRLFVG